MTRIVKVPDDPNASPQAARKRALALHGSRRYSKRYQTKLQKQIDREAEEHAKRDISLKIRRRWGVKR